MVRYLCCVVHMTDSLRVETGKFIESFVQAILSVYSLLHKFIATTCGGATWGDGGEGEALYGAVTSGSYYFVCLVEISAARTLCLPNISPDRGQIGFFPEGIRDECTGLNALLPHSSSSYLRKHAKRFFLPPPPPSKLHQI